MRRCRTCLPVLWLLAAVLLPVSAGRAAETFDLVVYGGTSAGVSAAIQTARMGKSVVLIEPLQHLGGLTTSGLGWTDSGNKSVIGGISREFYQNIRRHYDHDEAWQQEQKADYRRYDPENDAMWTFEPKVAEQVMHEMLRQAGVKNIVLGERLNRRSGVKQQGGRITAITMESGRSFAGRMFIDATYEGDLMAAAGVSYTVGREGNDRYGETLNGVQTRRAVSHQFIKPVDPYVEPGNPDSGLLPGIGQDPGVEGSGDKRLQAYNYRVCMTDAKENQVPFIKPEGYDPAEFELLLRNFEAGDMRLPLKIDMMPNRKTDLNNKHAVSTDMIGRNYDYPEADYATREKILRRHEMYVRGLLWTLAHHPRVPEKIRQQAGRWGLARDEFVDNRNWPYTAYIREARRMVSDYVHTELDCRRQRICEDPVGMGSYNMDSHNTQRYVDEHGHVRNEGDIQVSPGGPYLISYRSIVPRKSECENLLVPVCLSASHIAFGSIRMEPVFLILGQSAATAGCLAIDQQTTVQDLPYRLLRERLDADNLVLTLADQVTRAAGIPVAKLKGIVVDDLDAERTGQWLASASIGGYVGTGYLHDNAEQPGQKSVRFALPIKRAGQYEVRLAYTANPNRATRVAVTVHHAEGEATLSINQRQKPKIDGTFVSLGNYRFEPTSKPAVVVSNAQADGHVIADAVQLLPAE